MNNVSDSRTYLHVNKRNLLEASKNVRLFWERGVTLKIKLDITFISRKIYHQHSGN